MRNREVSHLKFKNLDEENGFTVLRYFAKGSREMVTPLNPKAENALSDYLQWVKGEGYSMSAEDYLFRGTKNVTNRPLDPKSLYYIIKKYAKLIGVKGKVTIHSARSTVIGMLLDKGHPLERVADFVGHRDISMTKAYNKRRLQIHHLGLRKSFGEGSDYEIFTVSIIHNHAVFFTDKYVNRRRPRNCSNGRGH